MANEYDKCNGYKGVFKRADNGKYYIRYRKQGKAIFEQAGLLCDSAAKANKERIARLAGAKPTNKEKIQSYKSINDVYTFNKLFIHYQEHRETIKSKAKEGDLWKSKVSPFFGNKHPAEITPIDTDKYKKEMLAKYKPQTVWLALELVRRVSNYAVSRKLAEGLTFKIDFPKIENIKNDKWTQTEIDNLLTVCNANPCQDSNVILLAYTTGLRRGDLCALQWPWIDTENGFINFPISKEDFKKVPLTLQAQAILKTIPKSDKTDLVFHHNNKPYLNYNIKDPNILKAIPQGKRPLHSLRVTFTSQLATTGFTLKEAQQMTAHKTITSVNRYTHFSEQEQKEIAARVSVKFSEMSKTPQDAPANAPD